MKYLQLSDAEGMMLKIIAGCIFAFLIVFTSCLCMLLKITVQAAFLWPLIALACGFASISSFDFKQFRESDYGFVTRKGEADAQVAAATKATASSVTVGGPATVTPTPPTET